MGMDRPGPNAHLAQGGSPFPDENERFRKQRGLSLQPGSPADPSRRFCASLSCFPFVLRPEDAAAQLKSSQPARTRLSPASAHSPPGCTGGEGCSLNSQLHPRSSYLSVRAQSALGRDYREIRESESRGCRNREGRSQAGHRPSTFTSGSRLLLEALTSDFLPDKQNQSTELAHVPDEG